MEWDNLIDLILNSIQIIGVFIAIVIGLIISKVMDLKKEKNEAIDTIEDINNELENMNKQFDKLNTFQLLNFFCIFLLKHYSLYFLQLLTYILLHIHKNLFGLVH